MRLQSAGALTDRRAIDCRDEIHELLEPQVMVDKAHTIPREKIGETFGRLEEDVMLAVNRALALFLGFA